MKEFNYEYTIDEHYKVTIHDTVNNLEWITTTEPETIPNHFTFHFKDNDLIAYSNGNGYIIPLADEPNAQWILKYNNGTNYDPPVYLDDDGAASLLKACEEAYITPPLTVSSYDKGKRPDDEEPLDWDENCQEKDENQDWQDEAKQNLIEDIMGARRPDFE
jgi:hypothetical protein